jgi:hypothetical protein
MAQEDNFTPDELDFHVGVAKSLGREEVQLPLGAESSSRWPSRGVFVILHVTIMVTRNRRGGVGCSHWSLVSLVSLL